jgi:cation transport ATPase
MPISLHPTWHPMMVHMAVGFTLGSSLLIIIGAIAEGLKYRDFAVKLTYPIHVMLLLAIISLVAAAASALADFPAATFSASPWFKFKTIVTIIVFFIYSGMYLLVALVTDRIWRSKAALSYMVVLAIVGAFLVASLGAAGGYMEYGHSVLEPLLRILGLPMPRG